MVKYKALIILDVTDICHLVLVCKHQDRTPISGYSKLLFTVGLV